MSSDQREPKANQDDTGDSSGIEAWLRREWIGLVAVLLAALPVVVVLVLGWCRGWRHDEWKALGPLLSAVYTATGFIAAGWYFLFRKARGYHIPNLTLGVTCERSAAPDQGWDWLAVTVALKKGDRNSVSLLSATVRVTHRIGDTDVLDNEIPLWGCVSVMPQTAGGKPVTNWEPSVDVEQLNMPPGEETQFAVVFWVPANVGYRIDVVVRGWQHGDGKIGTWQASAASIPNPPKPA